MVIKSRGKNNKVEKLEALISRLNPGHPQWEWIKEELHKRQSGERGERSLDYHLTFLPQDEFFILHDLRLKNEQGYFFQIDTLLLSSRFFTIIDVKNYGGSLFLDHHFNQLIQQSSNGNKKGLLDPISQIRRQQLQFKNWMKSNGMKDIPVESLIILSNSSTIIETTSNPSYYDKITRSINIDNKIEQFKLKYPKEIFTKEELWPFAKALVTAHTPSDYDPLKYFKITQADLLKGVCCPSCSILPMIRLHGNWQCSVCMYNCKDAHIRALQDYKLLISDTITVREMCSFLGMSSRYSAYRLIRAMSLCHSGGTKGREYFL
ncbi:nuclease-related domain-containing protein [Siminovitchia terrae]|nr:nuclease-related domain-containing protein [Siminovitchia terrae]